MLSLKISRKIGTAKSVGGKTSNVGTPDNETDDNPTPKMFVISAG